MIIQVKPQETSTSYLNKAIPFAASQIEINKNSLIVTLDNAKSVNRLFTKLGQTNTVAGLENKPIPSLKVNKKDNKIEFLGSSAGFGFIIKLLHDLKFISEDAKVACDKELSVAVNSNTLTNKA